MGRVGNVSVKAFNKVKSDSGGRCAKDGRAGRVRDRAELAPGLELRLVLARSLSLLCGVCAMLCCAVIAARDVVLVDERMND